MKGLLKPTRVTVDEHAFLVRPDPSQPGVYHFDWLTGTPNYGFTVGRSDGGPMSMREAEEFIRGFLAQIDPETGYIGD
jgi:hypothetical protein